jgi:hypothetical protein
MAAGSHTRRDRRRGATCQVATVSSQEKTKLIRGPLRTSSVSVAAAVTQCGIQRIVLALLLPTSGVLQASFAKVLGLPVGGPAAACP